MNYLQSYLDNVKAKVGDVLTEAISETVSAIADKYIFNFSYKENVIGLLVGDVQSGKTSHMFGLICAAADAGFANFILLTTDNTLLQQQTLQRAYADLQGFCICDESDYIKFRKNNFNVPSLIILKKNPSILRQWKNNILSMQCNGYPLFIVDDEGDAASLNTQVNKNRQSTINKYLKEIKKCTSSSIYLEVTGTPQAILLQTIKSKWKPYFIHYFRPGKNYIGGNVLFQSDNPEQIIFTDNEEITDILVDDEFPENGLKKALVTHLITSGHIIQNGGKVCNFLIHPSAETKKHAIFRDKIERYLNEINYSYDEENTKETFKNVYLGLKNTKHDIMPFDLIYKYVITHLLNINIIVLNSNAPYKESDSYSKGINIIIGGNSLGRGITFPCLQTIYYCRIAKNPQADTMWQHARMFGYDRDIKLLRIFMPPKLFKLFSEINKTNNSIIGQIEKNNNENNIKIIYPKGLSPTRKNVLDKKAIKIYAGGVNYFPFYPINIDLESINKLLSGFDDGVYNVSLKFITILMKHFDSENNDWNANIFISLINAILAEKSISKAILIVRRNRDIGKGTGTLLSPNDRTTGDLYTDCVVLTVYNILGSIEKGWNGQQIWIPNIKLPEECIYYSEESN